MDPAETRSEVSSSDDESQEEKIRDLQPVEEVVQEVLRPEYQPSELGQLVCYLRDMVLLFDLRDCDWTQECLSGIEKWFLENQHPVLFIFYSPENTLCASLTVPLVPFYDATYFIRQPNEIFRVDNFHDTIQYGTIQDPDESLLVLMETIYAPHFFQHEPPLEWSERVRVNFLSAIDSFLIGVTDLHYKMSGLTVLAMPPLHDTVSVEDEFTVGRLEQLIIHWMGQVRLFLSDNEAQESLCPSDFYDFWVYRDEVLQGLVLQFDGSEVQQVLQVLESKQSIYIKQFKELVQDCSVEVDRAADNIRFLALLIDPCRQLEACTSPADIPQLLPEIIRTVLFIHRRSKYLKADAVIAQFRSLTNHLILYCRTKIGISDILQGFPREGIRLCSMSIDCCLAYREIYEAIMREGEEPDEALDEHVIFNPIDTFIERLQDMILICEYSEINAMVAPQFGGTWGKEFERTCAEMSMIFSGALDEIKDKQHLALDVREDLWSTKVIVQFKAILKQLDEIFQNMIKTAFLYCRTIDDRIEVLCALINYQNRASLAQCFNEYIDLLFDSAMDEIIAIKSFILEERTRKRKYALCERFSSSAFFLLANLKRMQRLKDTVNNRLFWLRENTPESVRLELDILEKLIQQDIQSNFEEWKASIPDNMINCLQRSLLVRSLSRPGLLECNIDRNLVVLLREATAFKRLQFATPINITQLLLKCGQVKCVFESAVTMCLDYNRIIVSLTEKERLLFRPLIKTCDKKITAGIYKLNWAGELADNYTAECLQLTAQMQEFLTSYKVANMRVVELCEQICEQEVVQLFVKELSDLSSLEERLVATKSAGCDKLMHFYREIVEQIVAVHEGFAGHKDTHTPLAVQEEANGEWCEYVKKIDKLLEKAFCHCAQRNLQTIVQQLCGTNSLRILPFVRVQVLLDVDSHALVFHPEISSISLLFGSIFARLLNTFKLFQRLQVHLRIPIKDQVHTGGFFDVLKRDGKCVEYQRMISRGKLS